MYSRRLSRSVGRGGLPHQRAAKGGAAEALQRRVFSLESDLALAVADREQLCDLANSLQDELTAAAEHEQAELCEAQERIAALEREKQNILQTVEDGMDRMKEKRAAERAEVEVLKVDHARELAFLAERAAAPVPPAPIFAPTPALPTANLFAGAFRFDDMVRDEELAKCRAENAELRTELAASDGVARQDAAAALERSGCAAAEAATQHDEAQRALEAALVELEASRARASTLAEWKHHHEFLDTLSPRTRYVENPYCTTCSILLP